MPSEVVVNLPASPTQVTWVRLASLPCSDRKSGLLSQFESRRGLCDGQDSEGGWYGDQWDGLEEVEVSEEEEVELGVECPYS